MNFLAGASGLAGRCVHSRVGAAKAGKLGNFWVDLLRSPIYGLHLVNFDQSFFPNNLILKVEDCCPRENISA
jgi:hypothetical protein